MRKKMSIENSALFQVIIIAKVVCENISMETLAKICDAFQCEITNVIELTGELPEETK